MRGRGPASQLDAEVAEHRGHRERVRGRDHIYRGVRMKGTDNFSPGIPACSEGGELRVLARGLVSRPPGVHLLVPAPPTCGAADTDMRSPYSGMSIGANMARTFLTPVGNSADSFLSV